MSQDGVSERIGLIERGLAVQQERQASHEKYCEERDDRTAADIKSVRDNIHGIRNSMQKQGEEFNSKVNEVKTSCAVVQAAVQAIPGLIESAVSAGNKSNKLWIALQALVVAGAIILFLADLALRGLPHGP